MLSGGSDLNGTRDSSSAPRTSPSSYMGTRIYTFLLTAESRLNSQCEVQAGLRPGHFQDTVSTGKAAVRMPSARPVLQGNGGGAEGRLWDCGIHCLVFSLGHSILL